MRRFRSVFSRFLHFPSESREILLGVGSSSGPGQSSLYLDGIEHGFSSGFHSSLAALRTSSRNFLSADEHPKVIDEWLANEVSKGRVARPFPLSPFSHSQCSPFGVIPKKDQPGKWWLILDLSSPHGHSVNNGIPKDPYSLQYISVDDALRILLF